MNKVVDRLVKDGRWMSFILVLVYFALLFCMERSVGSTEAWARLGVDHMDPLFADLRVITSAVDCLDLGHDPLVENPCDPWHRPMNYPRVWLTIGSMLHLHSQHSTVLGLGLAVLFFATSFFLVGKLNLAEGITFGILLVTPPIMFAVERGNIDLVVFILLGLALGGVKGRQFSRWLSYCLVLAAGILKLYPACGLVLCGREKARVSLWIAAFFVAIFGLYVALIYHDLHSISAGTPRSSFSSYGSRVLFDRLDGGHHLPPGLAFLPWVAVGLTSLAAVCAAHRIPKMQIPAEAVDSLRLGLTLYVATFILGNNWNYRLALLLLAVPGIFASLRDKRSVGVGCLLLLFTMSMLLLSTSVEINKVQFCLREVVAWTTFAFSLVVLIQLIPDDLLRFVGGKPTLPDRAQ